MSDSLIIGEQIELIGPGGAAVDPMGTPSVNPLAAGATYRLIAPTAARGGVTWDLGAPQPTTDIVGSLLLDGERPFGYRASNRTITLPIIVKAPTFQALVAARELLLKEIDEQTWTLRWTRDTLGPFAGNAVGLPLLFDCFRAAPTVYEWGGFYHRIPYGIVTITFQALPYARSDLPVVVDFPEAIAGRTPPPPPVNVDTFSSVSGAQWAANAQSPVSGGQSAFWDPGLANQPDGRGLAAAYTNAGPLGIPMCQGWDAIFQGAGTTSQFVALAGDVAKVSVGDTFQIGANSLSGDSVGFEGGTTGNWASTGAGTANCSISNTTAQAHTGTHSLAMSSTAAGTMDATSGTAANITVTMSPVLPGDTVFASAWLRAATIARGCQVGVQFFSAGPSFANLGASFGLGGAVNDSTTAWTQVSTSLGAIAPAFAAWACVVVQVNATGGAAEVHYVDDVVLVTRSSALAQTQIFTVTSVTPPSLGFQNVNFTPAAAAGTNLPGVAIQTSPSQVNTLVFWAGFGSTNYYKQWARLGGRVHFGVTLTDTYGTSLQFGKAFKLAGSNQTGLPKWHKIRIPVPYNPGFDYNNVASYTITTTNRGTKDLRYTQLYLSALTAVPPPVVSPTIPISRGKVYDLNGLPGTARAPFSIQCQQTGTTNVNKWFTVPGTYYWTCPAGVTSVAVFNIGGGGMGFGNASVGTGGGGGGGSAGNNAVAVTPGNTYKVVVGAGAKVVNAYIYVPFNATASTFTGDSVTVTANPGASNFTGTTAGQAGGAAGVGGFAGGTGGAGVNAANGGGGGGGGSGGDLNAGNAGGAASGTTGGAGATSAGPFSGAGGRGGTFGHGNGISPSAGNFGGAAGGSPGGSSGTFLPGLGGLVLLGYNVPKTFMSLVVHQPPPAAPESLSPVLPVSIGDPADGSVVYPLQALNSPGLNARFGGTYTIAVVANSWASPSSARTITVTITQYEQGGGASYVATASQSITPSTLPSLSDTSAGNSPIVLLGELTLPIQDIPQDNTQCYFTASITSGQPTDTFSDILFLDTQGSTTIIQSPTGYSNYYLDEAGSDRDIGMVLGSLFDRGDAISILDRATVTGGPLRITPDGNPWLLVYSVEGTPQTQVHYFPRWWLDRYE